LLRSLASPHYSNIDIVQPECLIPNLDYRWKWYFTMALPIGCFLLLTFMYLVSYISKRITKSKAYSNVENWNKIIAMFTMSFYYIYLSVTRRALDIFNCNPSIPSDGYIYTEFTSVACEGGLCKCNEPGTVQQFLVPFALTGLIVYSIGFPAFIGYIIYRWKYVIVEDQIMRAHGLAVTRKTHPVAFHVSQRWHKMYYHFKPGKVYWIVLIITRKLAIAFIGLMLRGNPGFQLACCLLVMFICYMLQVRYKPYMSMSEREAVIENHKLKVKVYRKLDKLGEPKPTNIIAHHKIAANMKESLLALKSNVNRRRTTVAAPLPTESFMRREEAAKQTCRGKCAACRHRTFSRFACCNPRRSTEQEMSEAEKEAMARASAREYYFDYNQVEATLLACAVMVCLAGVLFENDRFSEAALKANPGLLWQQELITYIVLFIILTSLVYYAVVFVSEVFGYTPKRMVECCDKFGKGRKRLSEWGGPPEVNGRSSTVDSRSFSNNTYAGDVLDMITNPLHDDGPSHVPSHGRHSDGHDLDSVGRLSELMSDDTDFDDDDLMNEHELRRELKRMRGDNERLRTKDTHQGRPPSMRLSSPRQEEARADGGSMHVSWGSQGGAAGSVAKPQMISVAQERQKSGRFAVGGGAESKSGGDPYADRPPSYDAAPSRPNRPAPDSGPVKGVANVEMMEMGGNGDDLDDDGTIDESDDASLRANSTARSTVSSSSRVSL
jgi:hypothetical protein